MDKYIDAILKLSDQPCENPKFEEEYITTPYLHQCPKCLGWRAFCSNCATDHHEGGWKKCKLLELISQAIEEAVKEEREKTIDLMNNLYKEVLENLKHHNNNLGLWLNGALRPTVESDEEAQQVMEGLRGAMNEDKIFLNELDQLKHQLQQKEEIK